MEDLFDHRFLRRLYNLLIVAYENILLLQAGQYLTFVWYALLRFIAGLLAVLCGIWFTKMLAAWESRFGMAWTVDEMIIFDAKDSYELQ